MDAFTLNDGMPFAVVIYAVQCSFGLPQGPELHLQFGFILKIYFRYSHGCFYFKLFKVRGKHRCDPRKVMFHSSSTKNVYKPTS